MTKFENINTEALYYLLLSYDCRFKNIDHLNEVITSSIGEIQHKINNNTQVHNDYNKK